MNATLSKKSEHVLQFSIIVSPLLTTKRRQKERPLIVYEVIVNMVFVYLLRANIISSFGKPKVVALACILFHNKNSYASTAWTRIGAAPASNGA